MRFGLTLTAAVGVVLVAGSMVAAAPAHGTGPTAYVRGGFDEQFYQSCDTAGTCNTITTGTVVIAFQRTGSTASSLGIFYKVVNGTAVDGVDFSTPATGEEVIPAGQTIANLSVPLLYTGLFGSATKSFSIQITGTTVPITITNSTASGLIEGGNVASDCTFTYGGGLTLSLGCTGRPPTQIWHLQVACGDFGKAAGNKVTGDGTSTATCITTIDNEYMAVDS